MNLKQEAQAALPDIIRWRRDLHRVPETGLFLPQTREIVCRVLSGLGISFHTCDSCDGIWADIGQGSPGIAIRADMDGLPIVEDTGLPFASQNGNMHACGHDAHTAVLLGVAKLLKAHENELQGTVRLLFQPGEEGPGGAELMVKEGALEGMDRILACHVGSLAGLFDLGHIALSYTDTFAEDDEAVIEIRGQGGHASMPELCVDPVSTAVLLVNNLQYILTRETSAFASSVLTVSGIESPQGMCNIIPDRAVVRANIRNTSPDVADFVKKRVTEIAEGTAHMMRAECSVRFAGYPAVVNDRATAQQLIDSAARLIPAEAIHILPHGILGGEDASYFFREIPGCYFFLGNMRPCEKDNRIYPHHSARFDIDESVLWEPAAIFIQTAADLMEKLTVKGENENGK